MRPSSSPSDRSPTDPQHPPPPVPERPARGALFDPLFTTDAVAEAVSDRAWLAAMLDAEAALARAQARLGMIPAAAAEAIAAACRPERFDQRFDPGAIGRAAASTGSPVIPLVRALREAVPGDAARFVHQGATSQDVIDSAAMLVARRALGHVLDDLGALERACARLAEAHRSTPMAGRTLLQQAVPTTFGLKAAGWLVALDEARRRLSEVRDTRLAAQLGGAAGTLAAQGGRGVELLDAFADELGLCRPVLPWHTGRVRVGELAGALGVVAGVAGKIAADLALLAQTEVGEVAEAAGAGRGGSSAMPHKRNPVGAVLATACARRAPGLVATLLAAMTQEHERAAGAWQAEWETLTDLLRVVAGAVGRLLDALDHLVVDPDRMRANLDAGGGLPLAERVTGLLAASLGRPEAHELVEAAAGRAVETGRPLRAALLEDRRVRDRLTPDQIDAALDPTTALGAAEALVDRALANHRQPGRQDA